MLFECWRVCLIVVRCVRRWWLSREVVVKGVVGRGNGFGVLIEERTIHVYLSIDLCKVICFIYL